MRIIAGAEVRLRIVGIRVDPTEIVSRSQHSWLSSECSALIQHIQHVVASPFNEARCWLVLTVISSAAQFCVGTIRDDYLGVIGEQG